MKLKARNACVCLLAMVLLCSGCSFNTISPPATPTPMMKDAASPILPETSPIKTSSLGSAGLFNEDNFTKYFQFGMSRRDAERVLDKLNIGWSESMYISQEGEAPPDLPEGFWDVKGDGFTLRFNNKDQLYYLDTSLFDTSRGLRIGDWAETMHQLYGQEDEFNDGEYVYHKSGYYFAVDTSEDNGVWCWKVFMNIWNGPVDFKQPATAQLPGSDDPIKFNENNFSNYFHFGMSESDVKNVLNKLGVRIVIDHLEIETDHIIFSFDNDRLTFIQVRGWETAKGLNPGDSEDMLYKLYGKESRSGDDYADEKEYIYDMNGYSFVVQMDNWSADHVYKVDYWIVCPSD